MKIITLSSGEKSDEIRHKILHIINEYSPMITGYELVGVIDVVREDVHKSVEARDEE